MANTTSAKKATRKIARRTIVNKSRRTQMRGAVRTVEEAIKSGDRDAALKAMQHAEPELMQAAQRNIIHRNNASRKVSRLTQRSPSSRSELTRNRHTSKARPCAGLLFFRPTMPRVRARKPISPCMHRAYTHVNLFLAQAERCRL